MAIRALVFGENVHERINETVRSIYPNGMHAVIADALREDAGIEAAAVTLQDPEHGCTEERLAETDVLLWWGHKAHGDVSDAVVERVVHHVWQGMGLVVLHSGHFAKVFRRLMGAPCALTWREAGERERIWTVSPGHPIAAGVPASFVLEHEEMYGEPFSVPEPDETVFVSWFQGGEVFRSGLTWRRGAGRIFYFRPGHETYPTYYDPTVRTILRNGVRWAHNSAPRWRDVLEAPNVPAESAPEPIAPRGASLHAPGEAGYR